MSILANRKTRVLIQGITGTQASFHVKKSIDYGTNVVGGTSPKFRKKEYLGVPVFHSVAEAKKEIEFEASVLFVPSQAAKNAVREAVESGVKLLVSIAQGIPMHDMLEIKSMLKANGALMIGPNTPGLVTPGEARLGIFPENILTNGCVGIISRASTLTYEAILETNMAKLGQSTVVGLGDDLIIGTDFCELIRQFHDDDETKALVLVGKSDSLYEQLAADYYSSLPHKKPIVAFVAGEALPFEHNMGYAGDILTRGRITVQNKKKLMRDAGMIVVDSVNQIHLALQELRL